MNTEALNTRALGDGVSPFRDYITAVTTAVATFVTTFIVWREVSSAITAKATSVDGFRAKFQAAANVVAQAYSSVTVYAPAAQYIIGSLISQASATISLKVTQFSTAVVTAVANFSISDTLNRMIGASVSGTATTAGAVGSHNDVQSTSASVTSGATCLFVLNFVAADSAIYATATGLFNPGIYIGSLAPATRIHDIIQDVRVVEIF